MQSSFLEEVSYEYDEPQQQSMTATMYPGFTSTAKQSTQKASTRSQMPKSYGSNSGWYSVGAPGSYSVGAPGSYSVGAPGSYSVGPYAGFPSTTTTGFPSTTTTTGFPTQSFTKFTPSAKAATKQTRTRITPRQTQKLQTSMPSSEPELQISVYEEVPLKGKAPRKQTPTRTQIEEEQAPELISFFEGEEEMSGLDQPLEPVQSTTREEFILVRNVLSAMEISLTNINAQIEDITERIDRLEQEFSSGQTPSFYGSSASLEAPTPSWT